MKAVTQELQAAISPKKALKILKDGNLRFQNNQSINRNLLEQVSDTSNGQYPFAAVLSCIDSRVPAEKVFDQGIGDLFSIRIAGNFVNDDILGSLEFACKLAGSKAIVVMGHTSCGAVKGACDQARLGHLTGMLENIRPAVESVKEPRERELRNSKNVEFVDEVARKNVELAINDIRTRSSILREMEEDGEISIQGAMYDVSSGAVKFV
jgi:carbonic anhydrase